MPNGWGLLLLWTLGWGFDTTDPRSFIPSPDAIWSFVCIVLVAAYSCYTRRVSDRANLGDVDAARASTLPVYRILLRDVAIGMCAVCVFSVAVMFAANLRSSGTLYALGILNLFRWFFYELIVEGIGIFFTQRTLGRRALYRALAPASVWAGCYAALNVALLAAFFNSKDLTPRFVVAALNFAIAAAYAVGPLGLNYGRPALRPYAWFSVVQRGLTGAGLVLSVFPPGGFPVIIFDLVMMVTQVVGFPLAIFAAVRADSQYWRGASRALPDARPGLFATCAAVLCGLGDIGTGLGLRGAEKSSKDHALVLRRSRSSVLLRWSGWALRCRCFDGSRVGRGLLWVFVGARFWNPRISHADAGAPLLGQTIGRHTGSYGGLAPAPSVAARCRRGGSVPNLHADIPSGGPATVLAWIAWPLRALVVFFFVIYALLVETVLAPLEAWLRLASRVPLVEDSESDTDSDDASAIAREHVEGDAERPSSQGPRNCARSCMRFISCCGVDVYPRRWCRWRCGDLRGFEEPPTEATAVLPAHQQRSMLARWRSTAELLERAEDEGSRRGTAAGDPLDILLELLDDAGDAFIIDFSRVRLVRHVYDGASVVVTYGMLAGAQSLSRPGAAQARLRPGSAGPLPVALKIGWYFFDTHAALRALQREARINKVLGAHPCIARFLGVCVCPPDVALVFQWYPRGTLRKALDAAVQTTRRHRVAAAGFAREAVVDDGMQGQYYASVRFVRRPRCGGENDAARGGGAEAVVNGVTEQLAMAELRQIEELADAIAGQPHPLPTTAVSALGSARGGVAGHGVASAACILAPVPSELCAWLDRFDAWGAKASHDAEAAAAGAPGASSVDPTRLEQVWADVTRRLGCGAPRGIAPTADRRATLDTVHEASDDDEGGFEIASPVSPVRLPLVGAHSVGGFSSRKNALSSAAPQQRSANRAASPSQSWGSSSLLRPTPEDIALHIQLLRDMPFLGGSPADVTACPFWAPQDWPVEDVGNLAACWQALQHNGAQGVPPIIAEPDASDAAAHGLRSWIARLRVARDIAAGLTHMHHGVSPPVLHLDMKPENVWLDSDWRGVLGDMGEARQLPEAAHVSAPLSAEGGRELREGGAQGQGGMGGGTHSSAQAISNGSSSPRRPIRPVVPPLTMNKGTPSYQAPEMRGGNAPAALPPHDRGTMSPQQLMQPSDWRLPLDLAPLRPSVVAAILGRAAPPAVTLTPLAYGPPADVYGLACVLWEVLTGGRPFQPPAGTASLAGARSLVEALAAELHARPPIPSCTPLAYAHLLRCGWHPVASRRPPASVFVAVLDRLLAAADSLLRIESIELRASRTSEAGARRTWRMSQELRGADVTFVNGALEEIAITSRGSESASESNGEAELGFESARERVEARKPVALGPTSSADALLRAWTGDRAAVGPSSVPIASPWPADAYRGFSVANSEVPLAPLSMLPPISGRSMSIDAGAPVLSACGQGREVTVDAALSPGEGTGVLVEDGNRHEATTGSVAEGVGCISTGLRTAAAAFAAASSPATSSPDLSGIGCDGAAAATAAGDSGAAASVATPVDPALFWDMQSS